MPNLPVRRFRTIATFAAFSAVFSLLMLGSASAQDPAAAGKTGCGSSAGGGVVALRPLAVQGGAASSLCVGRPIQSNVSSSGKPVSLASADFDEDGVPDLISGFAGDGGGTVTLHRGNVAALWPYGAAIAAGTPQAFLPDAKSFSLPEEPDFLVTGDFDADGHQDIVAAKLGSNVMYFLKGDGHGRFAAAKAISLAGSVTDLIAGEMNQADGLPDLAIGVTNATGAAALVYESPQGAVKAQPETFPLSHPAAALGLGRFSGGTLHDLVVGGGNQLTVIHGRARQLATGGGAAAAVVSTQAVSFGVRALVAGDFTGGGPSVAVLGDDNVVHVMAHAVTSVPVVAGSIAVAGKADSTATAGTASPGLQARVAAMSRMVAGGAAQEWTENSTVAMPSGFGSANPRLLRAHMSGSGLDDLVTVDGAHSQVHVVSTTAGVSALRAKAKTTLGTATSSTGTISSLDATGTPAAVLPMRLNPHGLSGLVTLVDGQSAPVVAPRDVAPAFTFVVTNTSDITSTSQKNSPPAGSLRAAMENAGAACLGTANICSITFNIPTTDPGYNSATGQWTIKPLSENVPNSLDNFALPPINATLTIDGYTQPGSSPNTLAVGSNAKIAIVIDGSLATTPGGSGLVPFDDQGSVFRGMAFVKWVTPVINGSTASGAEGVEANGVGDFIEGNYFGTADGKTLSANRIGIFVDNGPAGGSSGGNVIGGTTPQARNVISGNSVFNLTLLSTAFEGLVQGNYIGTDSSGTVAMPNNLDGVGTNGSQATIGGMLAGSGNVISGNPTNVDINDLTNGGAATGSFVQGNYIGTDATGTKAIATTSTGVSIVHSPRNYLIGGTTPSARNIISGNSTGVYIVDGTTNNIVQGNYIGTDVTGSVALGNLKQGVYTGSTTSTAAPAAGDIIGGSISGAGNLISGNGGDGISFNGSVFTGSVYTSNTAQANFIGTDATGSKAIPNQGNGIYIGPGGTGNSIGGTNSGLGNLIANNAKNGVLIDTAGTSAPGTGNTTVANIITGNTGAGVRVASGTGNRISVNSIYNNGALGIDIDAVGPSTNTHCNATNSGANMLQNYPVLTAGTGSIYISATATDSAGNTSEFSKSVQTTSVANLLSLAGTFDGKASSAFTIEFFSNPSADSSGYGQGQTFLGSMNVSTDANCNATITDSVNTAAADVGVALTQPFGFSVGPDFGLATYGATVTNYGAATGHNVVFTDVLPAQLVVSHTYCNVGTCQSPIVTTQGTCTVTGQTITCNLGVLAPGATANITIPVQALTEGSVSNTATVIATEPDPKLANNTATVTAAATNPYAFIDHLSPASALTNSGPLPLTIYGTGFIPLTTVTFNGTPLPVQRVVDNQLCGGGGFSTGEFCSAIEVVVPNSLLGTAGTADVEVSNPNSYSSGSNFTLASACTYSVFTSIGSTVDPAGTSLIPSSVSVGTNVSSCPWTATSTVPWAVILENASNTGSGSVDVAFAPNTTTSARMGSITVAGTTYSFTQGAGSATVCNNTFDMNGANFTAAGGPGTFNNTLSNSSCSAFVGPYPENTSLAPNNAWITVTSTNFQLSSGPVTYTVAQNNGPARTGSILVGGNVFAITQAAPSCYFVLSPTSDIFQAAGGTGSFTVTPVPSTCSWTATPSNSSQISVTSGASGTGNGTVNYTVAANAGGPLTPTISIGNASATSIFTANENAATTCTFTVSPVTRSFTSNGGTSYVAINASFDFCRWTATSNNPNDLGITKNTSGTGNGVIYFSVGQNTTGVSRTLSLTAGCVTFTVTQDVATVVAPAPVLTSLAPSSATAGSGAFTLTVNGSNFVSGATVNFNGTALTTTFVSASQVTAAVPASAITNAGGLPVSVTNPSGGGGTSNTLTFTVNAATNPVPTLSSISPSSVTAGGAAFTLTVTGSNFVSGATVNVNGSARTTVFGSATQLTASITAADIASAGTPQITVTNPTPGGGTSSAVALTVTQANNPVPVVSAISPASVTAGGAAFTLTVTGTSFVSGATVNVNGSARSTVFVSATQLTASITAADIASAGSPQITVTNPTPGGGASNAVTLTVTQANNPTPVVSAISPASVTAGGAAFTLTVTGTNFVSGATVNVNGSARSTVFGSATQLTASITAADIASAGSLQIAVTNPTPGGGASNAVTLTVTQANNPTPVVSAISPASVTAGGTAFTLSVTGTNFVTGAVVNVNGSARATSFSSATQVTASITAADIANAGSLQITVTNPTPGGGASNAVTLTVTQANNPTPALTSISPASAIAGGATFTLTVTGTSFVSGATVNVNGVARATTFVSATQLTTSITAADIASAGSLQISVSNPTPGGGTSNVLALTITQPSNPAPTLTSVSPSSVTAGSAAFTLTVTGTNFLTGSTVNVNGTARTTTYVSATQLTIGITAADVAASGTLQITVTNPAPGGGTSSAVSLTVNAAATASFTLATTGGSQTLVPGGSVQYTITATSQNGTFANPVTLAVSGLPTGATAAFVPATITPGSSSGSSTLTIQLPAAKVVSANLHTSAFLATLCPLFGLLFLPKHRRRRFVSLAVLLLVAGGAVGCGGGFTPTTTTHTYTVTITGTSGAITQTTTVQLTVNQ